MSINGQDDDDVVNTAKPDTTNFGVDEIKRIGRSLTTTTVRERDLHDRLATAQDKLRDASTLEKLIEMQVKTKTPAELQEYRDIAAKWRDKSEKAIPAIGNKLNLLHEARVERLNQRAINTISTAYSDASVNSLVTAQSGDASVQQRGTGLAQNSTWEQLQAQRTNIFSEIGKKRRENVNRAGQLIGPDNEEIESKFEEDAGAMKGYVAQLAPIQAAMKQLRSRGLDPESKQRSLVKIGDEAQNIVGFDQLKQDLKSGDHKLSRLNSDQLNKKEVEAAGKLVAALNAVAAAAGKTEEELAGLNKGAEDAAGELKEIQKVKAAGGGDSGDKIGKIAGIVSGLASAAAQAHNAIFVNQPQQQMANVAGYANIENQKYDMMHSAVDGNMTARLNLKGWGVAGGFGGRLAQNTGENMALQGIAAGAKAAEGGILAYGTGGLAGSEALAHGVAGVATIGMDALRHISTSQAEIAGINSSMHATKEINHVQGYQLQGYRDYSMGQLGAAGSMGDTRGSAYLDEVNSEEYMRSMRSYGLGTKEAVSLSQRGVQDMGSMFDSGMPMQAQRFENLGLGSAQENMQRMGAMSRGGQNPSQSLEKLLEMAVGKGLDSSKTQTMIAENTGQLVDRTAMGGGPDISNEVSKLLVGLVDKSNPNQELATRAAMYGAESNAAIMADQGANFSSMMAVSNLVSGLGLDSVSATNAQTMSPELLKTIANTADDAEAERLMLMSGGVDVSKNKAWKKDRKAFLSSMQGFAGDKLLRLQNVGMAMGTAEDSDKAVNWMNESPENRAAYIRGDTTDMPADVKEQLIKTVQASKLQNSGRDPGILLDQVAELKGAAKPVEPVNALGTGTIEANGWRTPMLPDTETQKSTFGFMMSEQVRGGQQEVDTAQAGGTALGGAGGRDRSRGLVGSGDAAAAAGPGELAMAAAAAKSAQDFGESATRMNAASDKLGVAAEKLLQIAGVIELAKVDRDKLANSPVFPDPNGGGSQSIEAYEGYQP